LRLGNRDVGETHLEARIQGRDLQIWGRPFSDARGAGQVQLKSPFPYSASVTLSLPEIRPFLPGGAIAQGVSGSIAGSIKAEGSIAELEASRAKATFTHLRISRSDFAAENAAPIRLSYAQGKLSVDSLTVRGPNTEVSLIGWVDPSRLDLKLNGTMDLR